MARRLLGGTLATLLPADCLICGAPLPWRQIGGACVDCWERLPWSPGLRRPAGPRGADAIAWAADYEGPIGRLIRALKFERLDWLGEPLGDSAARQIEPLMERLFRPGEGERRPRPDLIIPVPLHWRRRFTRGYNQAELLAAPMARAFGAPIVPGLLRRPKAGRRQLGSTRGERLRALAGAYRARASAGWNGSQGALAGASVLLVDDVVTTGATLEACAQALRRGGAARVVGVALARTPRRR